MSKIRLGKTATSRSRKKKVIEEISKKIDLRERNDFEEYLQGKGYSNTTVAGYSKDSSRFFDWLSEQDIEIENVNYNDITSYLLSLGNVLQHTKNCYLHGIRQYYNYLIFKKEVIENPVEFIKLRGAKRKTLYDILNRKELDNLYVSYSAPDPESKDKNQNWFKAMVLAQKRNKAILGLMLYQALDTRDLKLLSVSDIKLKEGKIYIPGTRKSNERELKILAPQIIDLMEYILTTRNELLVHRKEMHQQSEMPDQLFISIGSSEQFNIMPLLMKTLKKLSKKVTSLKQLKASVIVHWLKLYNLRQVQYMAGHRYVSSTESYMVNDIDLMIEEVEKYHPIG
jgi:integrase/recombinase XerD